MNLHKSRQAARTVLATALLALCLVGSSEAGAQDHSLWDRVLKTVTLNGLVSYAKLREEPKALDSYIESLGAVRTADYAVWSREDKIAFWINAYNSLTFKAVSDHYPIVPSALKSLRYPKNSIRQIPGVWDKLQFRVMGREMTLNEIEHDILRKEFKEPRVHMALVCASRGCPPLRGEAFIGPKLNSQLDDQARLFLASPDKFRIDERAGVVHLSPIFQWFGSDFQADYSPSEGFTRHNAAQRASLNFISRYLDDGRRRLLEPGDFKIKYLDYDWSLNERDKR